MDTAETIDAVRDELFAELGCLPARPPEIRVDQLWESPETGNRWRVKSLRLGHVEGSGKVGVMREPAPGLKLPKWEDGKYVFPAEAFKAMRFVG